MVECFLRCLADVLTLQKAGGGYTDEAGHKSHLYSLYLPPSGVILDAELTLATPERLWSVVPHCTDYVTQDA